MAEKKVFDLSTLRSITGGNSERMINYINMYIDQTSQEMLQLRQCYDEKKWEELERTAHKMKSSAGYMGIIKLQELATYIEEYESGNDMEKKELSKKIIEMEELFELAKKELMVEKKRLEK